MERKKKYAFLKDSKYTQGKRTAQYTRTMHKELHSQLRTAAPARSIRPQKIPGRKY